VEEAEEVEDQQDNKGNPEGSDFIEIFYINNGQ
jgi:hypothetical protein